MSSVFRLFNYRKSKEHDQKAFGCTGNACSISFFNFQTLLSCSDICLHTSPCSPSLVDLTQRFWKFISKQCVALVNTTTLSRTRSVIRIPWVYHLSLRNPPWSLELVIVGAEIRLKWTGPWLLAQRLHGSCSPGVWMCVAEPSCLNRGLLEELAGLPTIPPLPSLIPLKQTKGIQTTLPTPHWEGVLKHYSAKGMGEK